METPQLGMFQLWTLVGNELHLIRLTVLCISMYFLILKQEERCLAKSQSYSVSLSSCVQPLRVQRPGRSLPTEL